MWEREAGQDLRREEIWNRAGPVAMGRFRKIPSNFTSTLIGIDDIARSCTWSDLSLGSGMMVGSLLVTYSFITAGSVSAVGSG